MSTYANIAASPLADFLHAQQAAGSGPLEIQLQRTLRAIRTHLGMDVAYLAKLEDGRKLFNQDHAAIARISESPVFRPAPINIDASCSLENAGSQPAGPHVCIPIRLADGHVYGTFCCYSNSADPYLNERDQIMLRVFAEIATELIAADVETRQSLINMEKRIKRVLSSNAFSVVYQPILHLMNNSIVGYESLARFSPLPHRSPDVWFKEAEQVGLDLELECRAISLALNGLASLPPNTFISVNASPRTIISGGLERHFHGQPLDRIVLEVTEHAIIDIYAELSAALKPLRDHGLRLAIDDVGAGYATFRHILNLEPDIIKLDMSITRNIDTDSSRRALAAALVTFAEKTESEIVAEGVESAIEIAVLRSLGVKYAQGFFLGNPMLISEAVDHAGLESVM